MIHWDHILWRLKQLLVNPKRAFIGRFKLDQKAGDLEIWHQPSEFDPSLGQEFTMTERHPDGSSTVWSYDNKGRKIIEREPPLAEGSSD